MGPSLGKPSSYYLLISRVLVKLSPIRFRAFMSALICYPFTPSSPGTLKLRCGGQFGSDGSPVVSRSLLPRLASGNTKYRSQLYTESTKATNKTHRDTYSRFFPSTWATPRCQFSLMTFCSTLLSYPAVLKLPLSEAT